MSAVSPSVSIADDLLKILPRERVLSDPSELFVYESDGFTIAKSNPGAVVFPTNRDEVVRIVKLLSERDVQIVPRGSGTGLTGGCVAYANGVIVSTARMNKILKIDLDNRVAHGERGGPNTALSDAVSILPLNLDEPTKTLAEPAPKTSPARDPVDAAAGSRTIQNPKAPIQNPYHFAPDPSSQRASSIGGNAATNAGGIHTLKDFVTSNHILGMEMVLPDGTVMEIGGKDGCYESGPFDLPGLIDRKSVV